MFLQCRFNVFSGDTGLMRELDESPAFFQTGQDLRDFKRSIRWYGALDDAPVIRSGDVWVVQTLDQLGDGSIGVQVR